VFTVYKQQTKGWAMEDTDQEIEIVISPSGITLWWGVSQEMEEVAKELGKEAHEKASTYCG
jgi:hypothetical protein